LTVNRPRRPTLDATNGNKIFTDSSINIGLVHPAATQHGDCTDHIVSETYVDYCDATAYMYQTVTVYLVN